MMMDPMDPTARPSGLVVGDVELTDGQVQEMQDRIRAAGGWCAPTEVIYQVDPLPLSPRVLRDLHEDCRFWGLTQTQCIRHHARLADMYAKRTLANADHALSIANRGLKMATVLAVIATGLALLSILS